MKNTVYLLQVIKGWLNFTEISSFAVKIINTKLEPWQACILVEEIETGSLFFGILHKGFQLTNYEKLYGRKYEERG